MFIFVRNLTLVIIVALAGLFASEDLYLAVPVGELTIPADALPKNEEGLSSSWSTWAIQQVMVPYAVLESGGEIFCEPQTDKGLLAGMKLAMKVPAGTPIKGRLFVPKGDFSGMTAVPFTVPDGKASDRVAFEHIKSLHYARLANANLPGAAWFKYQQQSAGNLPPGDVAAGRSEMSRDDLDATFDLFSGGHALDENLQLERNLDVRVRDGDATDKADPPVELATISGVTVKEFDWTALCKDLKPALDPLSSSIPADQHALFFPSFAAMTTLMDEADLNGTPALRVFETRSEDARTRERYQKQLCLETSELARRFGPQLVSSVAVTGSDPYLRSGSDVAFLFAAKQPDLLVAFIANKQKAAIAAGAKPVNGQVGGITYAGAVNADRSLCSYLAKIGADRVAVTNSLAQLASLDAVATGKAPALAGALEYRFFRNRYPLNGDNAALLVITDAAIRRWCSPRWRIAESRRARAAAILSGLQASSADAIIVGQAKPEPQVNGLGKVWLAGDSWQSEIYGTLDFLTPIAELSFDQVTKVEADAYGRFRDRYQANWRGWFDPIALQLSAANNKLAADLTVMPLITGSDYRELVALTRDRVIPLNAGDSHDAIAHLIMALNLESRFGQQAGSFLFSMNPRFEANPFSWLGAAVSIYADADPFWDELAKAERPEAFLEKNYMRLPVAIQAEVKDVLKLTGFLTAARAMAEQSAPGMVSWETKKHGDIPYVKVAPTEMVTAEQPDMAKAAFYYAALPTAFIITFNEDLLLRALDRRAARLKAKAEAKPLPEVQPWLGDSLSVHVGLPFLQVLRALGNNRDIGNRTMMQVLAWSNLPILNEWKRRFPELDPLAVHERLFKIRLTCPGGGTYVWNSSFSCFESTIYGCPAAPKDGPGLPAIFSAFVAGDFGLTFEHDGVRARVAIEKAAQ